MTTGRATVMVDDTSNDNINDEDKLDDSNTCDEG